MQVVKWVNYACTLPTIVSISGEKKQCDRKLNTSDSHGVRSPTRVICNQKHVTRCPEKPPRLALRGAPKATPSFLMAFGYSLLVDYRFWYRIGTFVILQQTSLKVSYYGKVLLLRWNLLRFYMYTLHTGDTNQQSVCDPSTSNCDWSRGIVVIGTGEPLHGGFPRLKRGLQRLRGVYSLYKRMSYLTNMNNYNAYCIKIPQEVLQVKLFRTSSLFILLLKK